MFETMHSLLADMSFTPACLFASIIVLYMLVEHIIQYTNKTFPTYWAVFIHFNILVLALLYW